jgi:hypothetical protein
VSRVLGVRLWLASSIVLLLVVGCGSRDPDASERPDESSEPSGAASQRPGIPIFGPRESYPPIDLPFESGTLPRSVDFLGVGFTVTDARVTNTHPYTMFGEPAPGAQLFAIVDVTADNETSAATEYGFGPESFTLQTYSGQRLTTVDPPGVYDFRRLEAGASASDALVFGAFRPDVLDGASLLIGRPPDAPAVLPLTAPQYDPPYPVEVFAADGPVQSGAIAWSVLAGVAALDRPAGVCCPDTGSRADDGELFVTLTLRGLVDGSRYGQASITSDAVRLVVDGVAAKAFGFKGKANVPEGSTYDFDATWIVPADAAELLLEVGTGTPDIRRTALGIGLPPEAPSPSPSPTPAASPSPSAAVSASPSPSPS